MKSMIRITVAAVATLAMALLTSATADARGSGGFHGGGGGFHGGGGSFHSSGGGGGGFRGGGSYHGGSGVIVHDHTGGSGGGGYRNPGNYGDRGGGGYGGYGGGHYYGGGYYNGGYYPYFWRPGYVYGAYDPYYYGYGYGYGGGYYAGTGYGAYSTAPTTPIWYLGAGLFGTRIMSQKNTPEQLNSGGGVSIYGGLHIGPTLSLEFGWMGSMHNPATVDVGNGPQKDYLVLNAFTADAKIHFRNAAGGGNGAIVPFVEGGVGLYSLGSQAYGINSSGAGFQLGGGFDWNLSEHLTLGLRARYHGISMQPPDGVMGSNVYISAATVEGSLALHF